MFNNYYNHEMYEKCKHLYGVKITFTPSGFVINPYRMSKSGMSNMCRFCNFQIAHTMSDAVVFKSKSKRHTSNPYSATKEADAGLDHDRCVVMERIMEDLFKMEVNETVFSVLTFNAIKDRNARSVYISGDISVVFDTFIVDDGQHGETEYGNFTDYVAGLPEKFIEYSRYDMDKGEMKLIKMLGLHEEHRKS